MESKKVTAADVAAAIRDNQSADIFTGDYGRDIVRYSYEHPTEGTISCWMWLDDFNEATSFDPEDPDWGAQMVSFESDENSLFVEMCSRFAAGEDDFRVY